MSAKSPVTFILFDMAGFGHGITPTVFGSSGLADIDNRDAFAF